MNQTMNIISQLIDMIMNFDKPKSRVMDFAIMDKKSGMKIFDLQRRNTKLVK